MAKTDRQLTDALRRAAETLLGKGISDAEFNDLVNRFNRAQGNSQQRSIEALRGFTGFSEITIRAKAAASDNTDRIIRDLENTIDEWKPGT